MVSDWLTIASDSLTAAINPFGAELSSLRDGDGRELMTDADPAFWTGRAPILFPVIGCVNRGVIRVDGREYPMAKHGFARRSMFEVVVHESDRATFRLTDSAETRASYPFAFALEIEFRLDGTQLDVTARIENRSERAMPAQFGFHPAWAWPLPFGAPRGDHRITFAADEPGALLKLLPDGLIAAETRASPLEGRVLKLRDDLFENDALIWRPVRSNSVRYGAGDGPALDIAFPDTPALGIWTKPGARFVCIESWHGLADPEGFDGEFAEKPGVFIIAPGGMKRIGMAVTLRA